MIGKVLRIGFPEWTILGSENGGFRTSMRVQPKEQGGIDPRV
jgi:hypothetical protein